MPRQTSRSWRVHQLGAPRKALRLDAVEPAEPAAGEALVSLGAIGLNFPDLLVCAGRYQESPTLPFSPGFEGAGVVLSCGPDAAVRAGQHVTVVPELPNGSFQETLTVPSSQLFVVPDAMPLSVAAVLHVAYETAHVAMHRRAALQEGETLVVTGAAGGVGMAAVQLGRAAGARVVGVVTGAAKEEAVRSWGAEATVNLAEVSLGEGLRRATGGRRADVVIDTVGGELFDDLRRNLAFEGRLVVVGFAAGGIGSVPANRVLLGNYSIVGLHLARYRRENPGLLSAVHDELVSLWEKGVVAPVIDRVLLMDELVEGLEAIGRRETIGRVVVAP